MGPGFTGKNGVRYRFYFSTALRGRPHLAGLVKRVPATEIEQLIEHPIRERLNLAHAAPSDIFDGIDRIIINVNHIRIAMKPAYAQRLIEIPWKLTKSNTATIIESAGQNKTDSKSCRLSCVPMPGSTISCPDATIQSKRSPKTSNSIPRSSDNSSASRSWRRQSRKQCLQERRQLWWRSRKRCRSRGPSSGQR